jgi:hypothetical protein
LRTEFAISAWAAYAPGLETADQWRAWAARPWLPLGEGIPALPEMPAMSRRRLNAMGRMAVQAAYWCPPMESTVPTVLASRYGDAVRSLELLATVVRGDAVSPTAFGLSVHNAIGALYSIARGDRAQQVAVAAGAASAAAGLVEAAALLADGAPEVTVVCYDAALPEDHACFHDEPACCYAWAWRVCAPAPGQPRMELAVNRPGESGSHDPALPFGLDVLRFALSEDAAFSRAADHTSWTLRRA